MDPHSTPRASCVVLDDVDVRLEVDCVGENV